MTKLLLTILTLLITTSACIGAEEYNNNNNNTTVKEDWVTWPRKLTAEPGTVLETQVKEQVERWNEALGEPLLQFVEFNEDQDRTKILLVRIDETRTRATTTWTEILLAPRYTKCTVAHEIGHYLLVTHDKLPSGVMGYCNDGIGEITQENVDQALTIRDRHVN